MTLISVIPSPIGVLRGTIDVLKERGRAFGDYEYDGRCCVLGAMGVAAGYTPYYWSELQDTDPDEYEPVDDVLVSAGQLLAQVIDPDIRADQLDAGSLIDLVSGWNDGPKTLDLSLDPEYQTAPTDAAVFEALAEAARLAEQAGAAHA
ncbi:DUF6197 family protein [Nonomuraea sp. NPDC004702]